MEKFLASPYCKIIVLCVALLAIFAFAYHVGRNVRLAGKSHSMGDAAVPARDPSQGESPVRPETSP
jgi:hypothetical protein